MCKSWRNFKVIIEITVKEFIKQINFNIGLFLYIYQIELDVSESVYINGKGNVSKGGAVKGAKITVYPMFDNSYNVEIKKGVGGHGGGDDVLGRRIKDLK